MNKKFYFFFLMSVGLALQVGATVHVVTQQSLNFIPSSFTLSVGDTVRFEWTAGSHNTVSTDVPAGADSWNSPLNSGNQSYDYVVSVEGVYAYECTFHAGQDGEFTAEALASSVSTSRQANLELNVRTNTSGSLVVHLVNASGNHAVISLIDITGREVANIHQGAIANDDFTLRHDVSGFQRGIYFVRFQEGARVTTRKVLIQ